MLKDKYQTLKSASIAGLMSLVVILSAQAVFAEELDPVFYGRQRVNLYAGMLDSLGVSTETLLKGDWRPSETVTFHLEGVFSGSWGTANRYVRLLGEGLPGPVQEMFPFEDFHTGFSLSQAWGSVVLGPIDLVAGKQPLAWGTGYLFNPTSVVYPPSFPGEDLEEVPSTASLVVTAALPASLSLSAYLAFEDRFRTPRTASGEGRYERLPFGLRLAARTDFIDASVSFSREVPRLGESTTVDRVGADAAGTLFTAGWYAEAALVLPKNFAGMYEPGSIEIGEDLSFSVGGDWTIPGLEVTLRVEYAHLGDGEIEKDRYAWEELLGGKRALLAEDYLFVSLEREFFTDWKLTAASLVNLNEAGAALLGGLAWAPEPSVELEVGGRLYAGPAGGELDGRVPVPGLESADLTRPELQLGLTVFF